MTKIYIVQATSGEYSNRDEWVISAYKDEAQAKLELEKLSEICREWHKKFINSDFDHNIMTRFHEKFPHLCKSEYRSDLVTLFLTETNLL
jgi:hypothetical protein